MDSKTRIIIGCAIGALLLISAVSMISGAKAGVDPDAALKQAEQMYIEAMRGHCSVIGKRVTECYSGNKEQCGKLKESIDWFLTKYGEAPETACPAGTPRFLVEDED